MTREPHCAYEELLLSKSKSSAGFRSDLRYIRDKVFAGMLVDNGISFMREECGGLDSEIESQLAGCLGRIAAGICPAYSSDIGN